ncbi:MAG: galactose-1-phosphate uridylyltransferase [Nitrospirae bacterium]|nr:galactose-1-phosphate uridylyltransferase [Nitrospirota bacterium]MBF0536385.1 galactose-1-phosphate uridylyltransferase [Nitrospirota bacterium]MBF0618173.1 galactose-1-phosphate uridylyltransferase [Nitrospirota bacterium]
MSELRKDPIIGRWVIISTERGKRPSDFMSPSSRRKKLSGFCPFCPGHEYTTPNEILAFRGSQKTGPSDWTLRVVPNKFPALQIEGELERAGEHIFGRMNGIGAHEVIVETPSHELSLATMPSKSAEDVLWAFYSRLTDLKKDHRFQYILIYKNEGESAGSTLEHTHSQLIALPIVPKRVQEELDSSKKYFDFMEKCIYCDLIEQEKHMNKRVVCENDLYITLSAYAPRVPFEMWIMPKNHESSFRPKENSFAALAEIMQTTLKMLDKILDVPPYNFVIHTSPLNAEENHYYHWHIEIFPKLTKMAGFEWGSGFYINPTSPEDAVRFLKGGQ